MIFFSKHEMNIFYIFVTMLMFVIIFHHVDSNNKEIKLKNEIAELQNSLRIMDASYKNLQDEIESEKNHSKYVEFIHNIYKKENAWIPISEGGFHSNIPILVPVNGVETSQYGLRMHPLAREIKFHRGIDIATEVGTEIISPANGEVIISEICGGFGMLISIQHDNNVRTYFGHIDSSYVTPGQVVSVGDTIGTVGMSGLATGPHLHYEVWVDDVPVNPKSFFYE